MRGGLLRNRVVYQTRTETPGPLGNPVPGWSGTSGHWCRIRSPRGREVLVAQQYEATVTHVLTLRWPGYAFDPDGRFLLGPRVFQVVSSLDVDERNRQVDVLVTERVSPQETP